MIFFLPIILFLFFIITQFYIWKKSKIFWLYYCVLFAYTIFTQLGYLLYSKKLSAVSHFQYYGESIFIKYWLFVFLAFISIFLLFAIFYDKKLKMVHLEIKKTKKRKNFLYIIAILIYEAILIFFLIKNFENLSYYNQYILKNNKLWFYLFSFNGVIFLSFLYKILTEQRKKIKFLYSTLFLFSFSILVITCIRSGQRSDFFIPFIGIFSFILCVYKDKIKLNKIKLKNILISLVIIFIIISLLQGIRIIRGHEENINSFLMAIKRPQTYLTLLVPKNLIFQDWLAPSLTLATSINYKIIFPLKVIESNIKCFIPFISHKSIGSIMSKIIDPHGIQGYGYYILTEGYNFMGFFGFIYIAFIFVFGIKILETFFANTKDKYINSFMYGIMGILIIGVIRGQSIVFLKGLYLYFFPAILLLFLMNKRFCLKK